MSDHEAYDAGYDAYWDGADRDDNPYDQEEEPNKRRLWEEGWLKAREDDYDESEG